MLVALPVGETVRDLRRRLQLLLKVSQSPSQTSGAAVRRERSGECAVAFGVEWLGGILVRRRMCGCTTRARCLRTTPRR